MTCILRLLFAVWTVACLLGPSSGPLEAFAQINYDGPAIEYFKDPVPDRCLDSSLGFSKGWFGHNSSKEIVIESKDWDTIRITSAVAYILLKDVMGYNNVIVSERTQFSTDLLGDSPLRRCSTGASHVSLENWPASVPRSLVSKYVTREKTCTDAGSIGYNGREGFFVSNDALEKTKSLGYIDYHRSLASTPSMFNIFEQMSPEPLGSCGPVGFCNDFNANKTKGRYLSSKCKADTSACKVFYHSLPDWSPGIAEGIAEEYNLPLAFEYLFYEQESTLKTKMAEGKSVMFYHYLPSEFASSQNITRLNFAEYKSTCHKNISDLSVTNVKCDFPVQSLKKLIWTGLTEYDIAAFTFFGSLEISEADMDKLLASYAAYNRNNYDTACSWLRANTAKWQNSIPFLPTLIQFEDASISMRLPIAKISARVLRLEGSNGTATVKISDISNTSRGQLQLKSSGKQPGIVNKDYEIVTANGKLYADSEAEVLRWSAQDISAKNVEVRLLSGKANNLGIVLELSDLITTSGSIGLKTTNVIIELSECSDTVPGKKGSPAFIDHFDELFQFSEEGVIFTLTILCIFCVEVAFYTGRVIWKSIHGGGVRKVTPRSNVGDSSENSSNARNAKIHGLNFKESELIVTITPTLPNIFPIAAVCTDFLQITAIILASELKWLNNSDALDFLSFTGFTLEWYFWIIAVLTFLWTVYIILFMSGAGYGLEDSFYGRIFLVPSDYLIPIGSSMLFIPALVSYFKVFECVKTSFGATHDFVINTICVEACFSPFHWAYISVAGLLLIVYWPLAVTASPMWQTVQGDKQQLRYKPRFYLMDSILKSVLVFLRVFFRQFQVFYFTVIIMSLVIYISIFSLFVPCTVPWVVNFRLVVYSLMLTTAVVAFISVEHSTDDSIWPYICITSIFVIVLPCFIIWDLKVYPKKFEKQKENTREKIQSFLNNLYSEEDNESQSDAMSFRSRETEEGEREMTMQEFIIMLIDSESLKDTEIFLLAFLLSKKSPLLETVRDRYQRIPDKEWARCACVEFILKMTENFSDFQDVDMHSICLRPSKSNVNLRGSSISKANFKGLFSKRLGEFGQSNPKDSKNRLSPRLNGISIDSSQRSPKVETKSAENAKASAKQQADPVEESNENLELEAEELPNIFIKELEQ
eukprot:Nk52_evm14s372 gene=Nk52_evmTU14s372